MTGSYDRVPAGPARGAARREAELHGADEHVIAALKNTEQQLADLHRGLSQRTYYAVPATSR